MPSSKSVPAKRQTLNLAQLAAYDDILTDALVDHVFYWTTIPKNRSSYHPSRGVREDVISNIIQQEVVINKDMVAAEKKLLQTDGLKRFSNSLKSDREKEDFRRHLRRYAQIYSPDCPWEVSSTNRYTIVSHEACVVARRRIKRNESIKYLSGIQVNITPEEEKEMSLRKKDFSLVVSSRSKCTSLFMGPARFANHDCGANAKLMTTGHAGIEIIATRPIEVGEEVTVTYGDNYFGEDNCECLCRTCEDNLQNGWLPEEGTVVVKKSIEAGKVESYSLRTRRRDDSIGGSSRTPSLAPEIRPRIYKTRVKASGLRNNRDTSSAVDSPAPESEPRGRKRPRGSLATPPVTPAKKRKHLVEPLDDAPAASRASSASRSSSSSTRDAAETDVTSPEKDSPEPLDQTPSKTPSMADQKPVNNSGANAGPPSPDSASSQASPQMQKPQDLHIPVEATNRRHTMTISSILNTPTEEKFEPVLFDEDAREHAPTHIMESREKPDPRAEVEHVLASGVIGAVTIAASIEPSEEPETTSTPEIEAMPTRKKYQKRVFIKQTTPPARMRTPGDYVLTPLLLSEPEMAWIQCTNCSTYFVQQNAYFTKASCPRCERHSKLYGYIWPKTDKEGLSDKEERILDHRLIHRFLNTHEEKQIRNRSGAREPKEESEEVEVVEKARRGRPKKGSVTAAAKKTMAAIKAEEAEAEDTSRLRRSGRARTASSRLAI